MRGNYLSSAGQKSSPSVESTMVPSKSKRRPSKERVCVGAEKECSKEPMLLDIGLLEI